MSQTPHRRQGGIFERFQPVPIAKRIVLWAHIPSSLGANLFSVTVVVGVAISYVFAGAIYRRKTR